MAEQRSSIYSGGGKLYFRKFNADGTKEPLIYFGKTDGITMSVSVEYKEHYDTEGCESLLDARFPSKKTSEVKFSTSEITLEMLNRAFLGNLLSDTQAAETDKQINVAGTNVKPGYIVDLGVYNAEGITVTNADATTTYVEGTDYTFESKSGYLTILEGGAITAGEDLVVTLSTVPALEIRISAAMKQSALIGEFVVVTSSQTGNNYKYVFKRLSVAMDGDFQLKGEEVGTLSFTGSAMIDTTTVRGDLSDYVDIIELTTDAC